jgi:rare lipoprotein A
VKVRRVTAFGMGILIAAIPFTSSLAATAQTGVASVYSGEQTANGEYAHASALTAAHRTLPFGTMVKVTNIETDRSVVVRINDRGPYIKGRVIDLTPAGARAIGSSGLAQVTLTVLSVGTGRGHSDRSTEG